MDQQAQPKQLNVPKEFPVRRRSAVTDGVVVTFGAAACVVACGVYNELETTQSIGEGVAAADGGKDASDAAKDTGTDAPPPCTGAGNCDCACRCNGTIFTVGQETDDAGACAANQGHACGSGSSGGTYSSCQIVTLAECPNAPGWHGPDGGYGPCSL